MEITFLFYLVYSFNRKVKKLVQSLTVIDSGYMELVMRQRQRTPPSGPIEAHVTVHLEGPYHPVAIHVCGVGVR